MPASDLKLFAAFHKPFPQPKAEYIISIKGGNALGNTITDMAGDDTGLSISSLNATFSELTILYWIWKNGNRDGLKYWGLVHYRRYFCLDKGFGNFTRKKIYNFPESAVHLNDVVTDKLYNKLHQSLQTHDVVMPRRMHNYKKRGAYKSITQLYKEKHEGADWELMLEIIKERHPSYIKSFSFFDKNQMSYFNMMIAPWPIWDEYLSWLFDILFEVEKRVEKKTNAYQARLPGFISERLLNFFVHHHGYKIAHFPIAAFDK